MTTKIFLSTALVLLLASCKDNTTQETPQPETPKAFKEKSSYEIVSKGPRAGDLVDVLYEELLSKDTGLHMLEAQINDLNRSKNDSVKSFNRFHGRMQSYFESTDTHVSEIRDSLLRDKIKLIIASHLAKYDARVARHHELLKVLAAKDINISDLHTALKIVKTLPVIEKYQQTNLPAIQQIEGYIKQQDQAIHLADTLLKK
ncbi:hypothetical protein [Chitinophaga qingshengii]|uniref:DUF4142 domain-containing protein n=1 Tax=Chitinophaga qingshengii TaxID=1569794 RepID=A0ABR7TL21_9BACT|nr:hypothetical protein [Chitinophaga qingshengii]MBC9929754.1 hypothetical protein [Chitinophaga qingshengii]